MESRRVVAVVICLAAAAAFALVAFVSSSSYGGLLAQHSNRPALADLERALLLGRGRRSLPPGSMRKTSGAMGDLFCGDTVMQCGVWLNRLFPLRIFAKMNNFYAHFMGETGPTKIHEMEKKRLNLLLEYYNQKYNRTKRLLDLEHEELEAQSKLEDAEHQMRLQILHELLDAVSGNATENETHLHNDAAHVVQGVGLSNVTTETEAEIEKETT